MQMTEKLSSIPDGIVERLLLNTRKASTSHPNCCCPEGSNRSQLLLLNPWSHRRRACPGLMGRGTLPRTSSKNNIAMASMKPGARARESTMRRSILKTRDWRIACQTGTRHSTQTSSTWRVSKSCLLVSRDANGLPKNPLTASRQSRKKALDIDAIREDSFPATSRCPRQLNPRDGERQKRHLDESSDLRVQTPLLLATSPA